MYKKFFNLRKVATIVACFTNVVHHNSDDTVIENKPDKVADYKFEKESNGTEILVLVRINYNLDNWDFSNASNWYKMGN